MPPYPSRAPAASAPNRPLRGRSALRALLALGIAASLAGDAGAQATGSGDAEQFVAAWWNISNGLPQSSINEIVQIDSGEIWIATYGGLLSFDGVEFRRFDVATLPGLRSNRITGLANVGADGLWFSTQEGALHRWLDGRILETTQVPGSEGLIELLVARDGSLWTQGTGGAVRRFADGVWSDVLTASGSGVFHGLCLRDDGAVCVAASDELVIFEPSGVERSRATAPSRITAIGAAVGEDVWVGLDDGLARFREGRIRRYRIDPAPELPVHAIVDDRHGSVWTAIGPTVLRVSSDSSGSPFIGVQSSAELPTSFETRSILLDDEDNVWLGGAEAGLVRLRASRLHQFAWVHGGSTVTAMCPDDDGGAWVGYANRGLVRVSADDEEHEQRLDVAGTDPPAIRSLLHDRAGRTWVGVDDTWMRLTKSVYPEFVPVLSGAVFPPAVGPIVELPNGEVWLASQAGRLMRLGPDDAVLEQLDVRGPVDCLAAAPDGTLWVGAGDQVLHVAGGTVARFGPEQGVPAGTIRDLLPEADGGVWIATYGGGLARLADGRARRISRDEGLFDSSLARILLDERGRMWMLSNVALMVVDRDDLLATIEGRRPRIEPVVIGPEAGLNEGCFGAPGGFRDDAGRLWLGTIAGAVRIQAPDFPFNKREPRVRIQSVRTEDATLSATESLRVPAGTRRLQFDFAAFCLTAPERIRYRYRLDGYDDGWIDGDDTRHASYTALSPGAYTFCVEARNEDGVWSREPRELRFEILPTWWQTSIFRAALVLAALGAFYALHRVRVGAVQRRAETLLEATRGRVLAEERSSRLRDQLAHVARVATAGELATSLAHEVNQPLAAIVSNADAARRYLARDGTTSAELDPILRDIAQQGERASEVIRRLRQFLRKHEAERAELDVGALVHQTLPLLRREIEDQRATIELDLAGDLPAVSADPVQMQQVLVNLVKNACDAMSAQATERRIVIRTRSTDGVVALEVHDSGPGIEPAVLSRVFQPYVTTKATGMGLGLPICRTIVEAHGGRISVVSVATGAAFRVEIPVEPARTMR